MPIVPASLVIPSLEATIHELLHIPHVNLSFPSFTQPAFAQATASIAAGLFEYVASLNEESRDKKETVEEGLYSVAPEYAATLLGKGVGMCASFFCFCLFDAARARIAVKCGAVR